MFKLVLEKAEEPEFKLPTSTGSWKKQEGHIACVEPLVMRTHFPSPMEAIPFGVDAPCSGYIATCLKFSVL